MEVGEFTACLGEGAENSVIVRVVRAVRPASSAWFLIVIPSGLQPARDLLFLDGGNCAAGLKPGSII
jgi:hypothetical protein